MTREEIEAEAKRQAIEKAKTTEIVVQPPGGEDPLAIIEQRNRLMDRLLDAAIHATHPGQWTKIGDRPWPGGPACEAMARRCGVSWDEPTCEVTDIGDERGPGKLYTYRARFFLRGNIDSIWAEGHCDTRDQFLGTGLDYETKTLPEVSIGNIRQAAMTNMVVNGVTRLLGVRNLSWERLESIFGVGHDAFASVSFKEGGRGGGKGKAVTEKTLPFGRSKGKRIDEAAEEDLRWMLSKMKEPASDPKYQKSNDEWAAAIEAELAKRAGKKGAAAAGGGAPPPNAAWQRIRKMAAEQGGMPDDALGKWVKEVTGKGAPSLLTDEDVAAMAEAFEREKAALKG